MGQSGFDFRSGAGLVHAHAALQWQAADNNASLIGFNSLPNGAPTLGSIALNSYQSQGVTLQTSSQAGGYAALGAPPTTGSTAGFSGSSLVANGTPGATWIALQFVSPVTQVSFAFATASGHVDVELFDSNAQSHGVFSFNGATLTGFSGGNRLAGLASLPDVGPIGSIVVHAGSSDTDVRIDTLRFVSANAAFGPDADAPMLPLWALALLASGLLGITQARARPVSCTTSP
jgi:hypothetical protein